MCIYKPEFVYWISTKLIETQILPETMIQNEGEKLTHVCFILSGEAEYIMMKPVMKPYFKLTMGMFFGGEDIYFALKRHSEKIQR